MSNSPRRASALVQAGIMLSRLSGLLREGVIGHFLGLSLAANAYAYAFRIPNLLQNLLGEGVLSASFIPVHVGLIDAGRDEDARRLASTVLGLLAAVAGGAALLLSVFAGPLSSVLLVGADDELRVLVASLLRIIAPGLALLVISAWCLGVLNSHRQFFLSYVAPVVWNLSQVAILITVGVVLLDGPAEQASSEQLAALAEALAWGTLVGGALQVVVQVPAVRRLTPGVRPRLRPIGPHVREVLRAFTPVVAGRGVVQLATFVDLALASLLAGAALATIQKALVFALLPVALFGMAIAAAELPDLSSIDRTDRVRLLRRVEDGLARVAFYVVPTAVGFIVVGDLIVGTVYETGLFSADDVRIVWFVLIGSSLGMLPTTTGRLLQSVLYGGGDTRGPARIAMLRVVIAAGVGVVLMFQLDRIVLDGAGVALLQGQSLPAFGPLPEAVRSPSTQLLHLGPLGLTLASSVAAYVEYRLLRELVANRAGIDVRAGGQQRGRVLVAALVAGAVAFATRPLLDGLDNIIAGLLAVTIVASVHVGVAAALGIAEARVLLSTAQRVLRR